MLNGKTRHKAGFLNASDLRLADGVKDFDVEKAAAGASFLCRHEVSTLLKAFEVVVAQSGGFFASLPSLAIAAFSYDWGVD